VTIGRRLQPVSTSMSVAPVIAGLDFAEFGFARVHSRRRPGFLPLRAFSARVRLGGLARWKWCRAWLLQVAALPDGERLKGIVTAWRASRVVTLAVQERPAELFRRLSIA